MASGRMLDKDIALSEKLAKLKTSQAAQLWFMLTPHLDINGCQEASPTRLKGLVCPLDSKLPGEKIPDYLAALYEAELLIQYEVAERKYLWCPKFILKQRRHKRKDESPLFPLSEEISLLIEAEWKEKSERAGGIRGDSGGFGEARGNTRPKGREEKLNEDEDKKKGKEKSAPPVSFEDLKSHMKAVFKLETKKILSFHKFEIESLGELFNEYQGEEETLKKMWCYYVTTFCYELNEYATVKSFCKNASKIAQKL